MFCFTVIYGCLMMNLADCCNFGCSLLLVLGLFGRISCGVLFVGCLFCLALS